MGLDHSETSSSKVVFGFHRACRPACLEVTPITGQPRSDGNSVRRSRQRLIAYSRPTSSTPSPSQTISSSTRLNAAAPAAAGDGCRRDSGRSRNRCGPSPARLPVASAWPTNGLSVKGAHGGPPLLTRRLGPIISRKRSESAVFSKRARLSLCHRSSNSFLNQVGVRSPRLNGEYW